MYSYDKVLNGWIKKDTHHPLKKLCDPYVMH